MRFNFIRLNFTEHLYFNGKKYFITNIHQGDALFYKIISFHKSIYFPQKAQINAEN